MLVKQVRSLLWLSHWHNHREQRLVALYNRHLENLRELVAGQIGNRRCYERKLTICGIRLVVSNTYDGVQIEEIGAPTRFTGLQRNLFTARPRPKRQRPSVLTFPGTHQEEVGTDAAAA